MYKAPSFLALEPSWRQQPASERRAYSRPTSTCVMKALYAAHPSGSIAVTKAELNKCALLWDAAELSSSMSPLWLRVSFSEQIEAWLLALCCMCQLEKLVIDAYNLTELQSTVVLPPGVALHVYMLSGSLRPISVPWLRLQSSSTIYMHIRLYQQTPNQAQQAVLELQPLRIYSLHLETRYSQFSAELQHIWGQLKCCEHLHLAFRGQSGAVHALPICKCVHISGPISFPSKPVQCQFPIQWAAIGNRAGKVCISLDKSQRLCVEGHAELPLPCAAPWQLAVWSAAGITGLPSSRVRKEVYFLQNAAADAAGWRESATQKPAVYCPCLYNK